METLARLFLFFGLGTTTPLGAGEMFYTQRGANVLTTAGLDGSEPRDTIPAAGTNIRGVAIDVDTDDLFYADNGADVIYRSRLDGSGRATIVGSDLGFPADLALDREAGKLYWCDRNNNRIERSNYDGSGRETVLEATQPYYLDLDLTNGVIYWGDFSGGNIFRRDLAGGTVETFVDSNIQTRGVKVDPRGGYVYWCDRESHKVQRRPIGGGPIQDLYTGLDTPHGMTLDIPGRRIYWVDTGTNGVAGSRGGNAVNRGTMDGKGPHEILTAAAQPWDITLDTRVANYGEWLARTVPDTTPAARRQPGADLDGDGVPNGVEYYCGLDPASRQVAMPIFPFESGDEVHTVYRRTLDPVTDAVAAVEFSSDGVNWQSGPAVSEQVTEGTTLGPPFTGVISVRPLPPLTDGGTVLSRLRVEVTSP